MLKSFSIFSTAVAASAFTTAMWGGQVAGGALVAAIAGVGTTTLWAASGYIARRLNRPNDAVFMAHGVCPACETRNSMTEVSSHDGCSIVECRECHETFDIRPGESGPIVIRVGKPVAA